MNDAIPLPQRLVRVLTSGREKIAWPKQKVKSRIIAQQWVRFGEVLDARD
jgi:hypothetical protein